MRSCGHCTVSVTITLAQPPYRKINSLKSSALEFKWNFRIYTQPVVYLGSKPYATLEKLTKSRNQFSQYRNIKVLQTLKRQICMRFC